MFSIDNTNSTRKRINGIETRLGPITSATFKQKVLVGAIFHEDNSHSLLFHSLIANTFSFATICHFSVKAPSRVTFCKMLEEIVAQRFVNEVVHIETNKHDPTTNR